MLMIATRTDAPEGYVIDLARVMSLPSGLTYSDQWRYRDEWVAKDVVAAVQAGTDYSGQDVLICAALPKEGGGLSWAPLRRGVIERVTMQDKCVVAFRLGDIIRLPVDDQLQVVYESNDEKLIICPDTVSVDGFSFTNSIGDQPREWARTITALQRDPRSGGAFDKTVFSFAWVVDDSGQEPMKGETDVRVGLGTVSGYLLTAGEKYELLWEHRVPGMENTRQSLPEMRFKLNSVSGLTSGSGSVLVRGNYQDHAGWILNPTKTIGKLEYLEFGPEAAVPAGARVAETQIPVRVRFSRLNLIRRMWWRLLLLALALWVASMWSIFASASISTHLSISQILGQLIERWQFAVMAFAVAVFAVLAFILQKGDGKD